MLHCFSVGSRIAPGGRLPLRKLVRYGNAPAAGASATQDFKSTLRRDLMQVHNGGSLRSPKERGPAGAGAGAGDASGAGGGAGEVGGEREGASGRGWSRLPEIKQIAKGRPLRPHRSLPYPDLFFLPVTQNGIRSTVSSKSAIL
jgi:hypothetical protein